MVMELAENIWGNFFMIEKVVKKVVSFFIIPLVSHQIELDT